MYMYMHMCIYFHVMKVCHGEQIEIVLQKSMYIRMGALKELRMRERMREFVIVERVSQSVSQCS
jgi:hypothetical protein